VEQALVPEGVFAIQLLEALKLGSTQDEGLAESRLSAIGIEPRNGWIAGYPMTPPALVEIERGVAAAAENGRLKMSREEALRAVGDLKERVGLNVNPAAPPQTSPAQTGPGGQTAGTPTYKYIDRNGVIHFTDQYESIPGEYRDRVDTIRGTVRPPFSVDPAGQEMRTPTESTIPGPGAEVVNHYYYDYGPPVVTYYPPPAPYYYLYSWVPYPFWWGPGLYYSGYFILHDFHRHVGFHGRSYACSSYVTRGHSPHGFVVNPHTRGLQDSMTAKRWSSPQAFRSPGVQSGARTIAGINRARPASGGVQAPPRMAVPAAAPGGNRFQGPPRPSTQQRVTAVPATAPGNNAGRPAAPPVRAFTPPPAGGKALTPSPPRTAGTPQAAVMHAPVYSNPSPGGRSPVGGVYGGGGFSGGGRPGSRGFSSWGGGGSRGGGYR
jgi:hypothetical protein